MIKGRKT